MKIRGRLFTFHVLRFYIQFYIPSIFFVYISSISLPHIHPSHHVVVLYCVFFVSYSIKSSSTTTVVYEEKENQKLSLFVHGMKNSKIFYRIFLAFPIHNTRKFPAIIQWKSRKVLTDNWKHENSHRKIMFSNLTLKLWINFSTPTNLTSPSRVRLLWKNINKFHFPSNVVSAVMNGRVWKNQEEAKTTLVEMRENR